jgi:hypothetical protein
MYDFGMDLPDSRFQERFWLWPISVSHAWKSSIKFYDARNRCRIAQKRVSPWRYCGAELHQLDVTDACVHEG